MREDQKITGPGEVIFTSMPMIKMGKAEIPISVMLRAMSKIRLLNFARVCLFLLGVDFYTNLPLRQYPL
jgi:hypothetical protein